MAYFRTLLFNRGVTELTRSFAEFFLVSMSLAPSVDGGGAPGGLCLNQVFLLTAMNGVDAEVAAI